MLKRQKKQEVRFPGLPAESADTASSAAPARCSGGYISRLLLDFIGPRSAESDGFHHSCRVPFSQVQPSETAGGFPLRRPAPFPRSIHRPGLVFPGIFKK